MATRSVGRLYDRALSQAGLRAASFAILAVLAAEGPMPTSDLAARLAMDLTTCTREAAPLVVAGLVEVGVGSDRRYRLLRMTSLGDQRLSEGPRRGSRCRGWSPTHSAMPTFTTC